MASNKSKTPGPIQVVVVLMLTVLAFYFGNRFGQVFDFNTMEITDGALATVNSIVAAPAAISTASVPMLYAIGLAITVLIVWLYTFMYAGNYRYGEEAGSAKWGTLKEGVAFKDQSDPSNNLLFTKNYGLALKKPKFDLEHDRNLNVMVIGGSGSGKTRSIMNDGNDKHEGAWWGNLETLKPSQVQSDYSYVDEDDRRKKFIIIAAVIGIVLVLLLGGVTAFTVLSSNKGHDSDTKKEQTQTQKKETSTENAKKKKSAEKSAISVMVTADGAAEDSKASVSVSEKGKNGKIVVKDISVAVNDEVKICTLPKGKYLLTVESAPDGYDKPAKSTSFTVKGNGEKVSAFAFLAKHVDKTAESSESEDNVEATPADDGASQNQNNQAENSSADMNRGTSAPSSGNGQPSSTSTPTTTKTIHHPAETIRIAICDTCGADITDDIEGHKKSTGHPWYHYDAKVVKEAWDETVTVN